jgi:sulfate adenylyltransferase large subunit
MESERVRIAIAGHVDHGKSTLIGRLLCNTGSLPLDKIEEVKKACSDRDIRFEFGFLLDYLQEEREQGITIDSAQVFFSTAKRNYVIIDVPGHVAFIRNMITGTSQAEAALLVVSAEKGIEEQTRRHGYIMSLLGLSKVIVLITKMDLIGYRREIFDVIKPQILDLLESFAIRPFSIIPLSALEGDNISDKSDRMPWYNGLYLLEALEHLPTGNRSVESNLRFPIQDVYTIGGEKIAVGRVASGVIREGQNVVLLPSREEATVQSIRFFGKEIREAEQGQSIGVVLAQSPALQRGQVISDPGKRPEMRERFPATVFWMSEDSLTRGERLTLRCATQHIDCHIEKIYKRIDSSSLRILEEDADELGFSEVGVVLCCTQHPVIMENFATTPELGRFVLQKGNTVVAGGIMTDINGASVCR